jgi:predicted 3-demethylubiquinone-9 3-methyltransferase (glyoxalase superfamily)
MSVTFELDGQMFYALNGGLHFKFNPAVSFFITCKDQKEVDYYWNKLLKGGEPSKCGWLQDKYGLSWQVVPEALGECLGGKNREGAERAMQAMMEMVKLDVKALRTAYAGKPVAGRKWT